MQEHGKRGWDAAASLRTTARRIEASERLLQDHMISAYEHGMGVRQIGRHCGRSHRWVIDQLTAAGVYQTTTRKEASK